MTTTRSIAAAVASGLALAPAYATAPRVHRAPVPHVQPASSPSGAPAAEASRGATGAPGRAASQPASAPALSLEQRAFRATFTGEFDGLIADAALAWKHDPHWLRALLWEESKLDPRAVNPVSGAAGLGQATAKGRRGINERRCLRRTGRMRCNLGAHEYTREKALDPEHSIPATAEHLAALVQRWGVWDGVSHYNGGRNRVAFALRVLRHANRFRMQSGLPPLPGPRRRPPVGLTS